MWSGRYDRELTDIFAIEDEISRAIVNSLRLKLGRGRRRYETSTEAYDLYLRARARHSRESIPVFEQAIVKDPSFAPAYAGLALAHLSLSGQHGSPDGIPGELEKMQAAAERAIQLDPLSTEAYDALGAANAREAQWEQAAKNFLRSMEIQPNRVESHGYFAIYYLLPLGRIEEAIWHLRIAEKSNPLFTFFLGDALADAGRNNQAFGVCDKLPPTDSFKDECVPGALVRQGKADEVIQNYGARPANPASIETALACAYARTGRHEEAEKAAALSGRSGKPSAFACIGDKDRVFEALDRAAEFGPIRIGWFLLRVDREHPGLLRGDPRLRALRTRVGLPE
jgi:tetratricopeptide (TPR) repeat protein